MDGEQIGGTGGFELGGGWITLSIDDAPLKAGLAADEQLLREFVAKDYTIPLKFDIAPAKAALAELRAEFEKLAGGGFTIPMGAGMAQMGGGSVPNFGSQKIDIDTSAARASIQNLGADVRVLKDQLDVLTQAASGFSARGVAVPSALQSEIDTIQSQISRTGIRSAGFIPAVNDGSYSGNLGIGTGENIGMALASHDTAIRASRAAMNMPAVADLPQSGIRNLATGELETSFTPRRWGTGRYDMFQEYQLSQMDELDASSTPIADGGGTESEKAAAVSWQTRMFRRMAFRAAVFGAVYKGMELTRNLVTASQVSQFPNDPLLAMDRPGTMSVLDNDVLQDQSAAFTSYKASDARWAGFGFIDFEQADRQRMEKNLTRAMEQTQYGIQQQRQLPIELMTAGGFTGEAAAIKRTMRERAAQDDIIRANEAAMTEFRARTRHSWWEIYGPTTVTPDLSGVDVATENAEKISKVAAIEEESARRSEIGNRQQISSRIFGAADDLIASGLRSRANRTLMVGGADAEVYALQQQRAAQAAGNRAEIERFNGDTNAMLGRATEAERPGLTMERAAELTKLKAEQAEKLAEYDRRIITAERNSQHELTTVQAEGQAARLRLTHQNFAAEMAMFEAQATNRMASLRESGASAAVISQTQAAIDNERSTRVGLENERIGFSVATSAGRYSAAIAAMNRDPITGRLAQMDIEENIREHMTENPVERAAMRAAYQAERTNVVFQDQRSLALEGFDLSARTQAANLTTSNLGMSASATMAVARAREAIANADPRLRQQTIAAETAELRAMQHEQFGFRGGALSAAYGSLDEALAATGFGMDLGGTARDRRQANQIINGGIGNLGKPIPGTTPPTHGNVPPLAGGPQDPMDFNAGSHGQSRNDPRRMSHHSDVASPAAQDPSSAMGNSIDKAIRDAFKAALQGVTLFTTGS